ncbi:MAG TPA: twin-arginine translocase subunit TatC [Candidatus Sumerlaeota bacterium]|nr:twin-arginine translocase subunit TatC [Candidatus Sumerlaeota bacterium]HPS00146.1 twin-arginine translocase subunit TatC [Candidatus Sumerlaeota bacterium]
MLKLLKKEPDLNPERNMNILDHLEELRYRMILSILALVFGFVVGIFLAESTLHVLFLPFSGIDLHSNQTNMKIAIEPDGSLRLLNGKTPKELKGLNPYQLEFYLPTTVARMEGRVSQTEETVLAEDGDSSTSDTLKTQSDTEATSGGLANWIRSKLSFINWEKKVSEDIQPDFVWGNSIEKPIFLDPMDPVMLWLKTAFFLGLLIALPLILYQLWAFIAPGLLATEKNVIVPILAFACLLFPTGATIAYFGFRMMLRFLLTFQIANMQPAINVFNLLGLELQLMVGFGAAFELPIVIMFLTMLGLVNPAKLRAWRSYAIVVNAVVAAVVTPSPDPWNMLLTMIPLVVLYEISIWASIPIARKRAQADRELEEEENEENVRTVEAEAYSSLQTVEAPVSTEVASEAVPDDDEPVVGPYPGYESSSSPQSYYEPPVSEPEVAAPGEVSAVSEVYYGEPRDQRREDRKRWKRKQLRRMRYRPDEDE